MDFLLYIIIGGCVLFLVWDFLKKKNTENNGGKIASKYASFDDVKTHLEGFVPKTEARLKNGYTEKSVENQLVKYLKQKFVEVTPQYGIDGRNARSIDIDVANGVAGIELKDAKKVSKTAEMDRVKSQLIAYQDKRYQDNLILLVAGEAEDKDDSCLVELKEYCRKKGVKYYYFELNKGFIKC